MSIFEDLVAREPIFRGWYDDLKEVMPNGISYKKHALRRAFSVISRDNP